MRSKPLLRISVSTTAEADEQVTEILADVFGAAASSFTDTERGATSASVYLEEGLRRLTENRQELISRLRQLRETGVKIGSGRISARRIRREDWAESWKRHFQPLLIGRRLLVKPSWSKRRPRSGQTLITIDPGLSFGTGQHPTTRYCLRQLVAARRIGTGGGQSLLDLGTGSGILAIAAAKLGYAPVLAVDCDSDAVRIARRNAQLNGVRRGLTVVLGDVARLARGRQRFDVVCANLVHDLLVAERKRILAWVKPGGLLLLAGILEQQFSTVARAYAGAGARLEASLREGEWRSGTLRAP